MFVIDSIIASAGSRATPVHLVGSERLDEALKGQPLNVRRCAEAAGFKGKAGEWVAVPMAEGGVDRILFGVGSADDPMVFGAAPAALPEGLYSLEDAPAAISQRDAAFAWLLGAYKFDRYKARDRAPATLLVGDAAAREDAVREARAVYLARDLVNTPAEDMGPEALEDVARGLAKEFGAALRITAGDDLLKKNYALIHAVGRAAAEAPRLIEFEWGDKKHPRLALVGKGVCFDSGGLNLKTGDFMRLMKKDMGGAANALALARLIMEADLPFHLHVAIPAVENAVGAGAFRPGDILKSRKGLTVEIENTDAEGRLVLADALARVVEDDPQLILDFATLTGAARVALGAELAPFYTDDEGIAEDLAFAAKEARDPVWRMPLWAGYDAQIDSPIADVKNLGAGPMAGSITAALFLKRFVGDRPWAHFDIFAWNPAAKPGRPLGGEMQGARAAFRMLAKRAAD